MPPQVLRCNNSKEHYASDDKVLGLELISPRFLHMVNFMRFTYKIFDSRKTFSLLLGV